MDMQYVKNKIITLLKKNMLLVLFPLMAMVIEMTAVFVVEKTIFLKDSDGEMFTEDITCALKSNKTSAKFRKHQNIRPRTKISARGLMFQYKKENIYRDFIFASISSTANSTALSTSICSSMVRQACNTVE